MTSEARPRRATIAERLRRAAELRRNGLLLVALTAFMMSLPFVQEGGVGDFVIRIGFTAVVLSGIYSARSSPVAFLIAAVLAGLVLAADWGSILQKGAALTIVRSALSAAFIFFTAGVLVSHLARERTVTADTVLGGINIYLLLIAAFMFVHILIEAANAGAYRVGEQTLTDYLLDPAADETLAASTLIYFSITTFTTLGYGDIVPVSGAARMFAGFEAIVGQLYVAIIVARLVAMQIGHSTAEPE